MSRVILIFVLSVGIASANGRQSKDCENITCEKPPSNADCTVVDKNDKTLPRPQGKQAECCSFWKCKEKNKPGFFTFHGILRNGKKDGGGTEIVRYSKTAANGLPVLQKVSSIATGDHDSIALSSSGGSPTIKTEDVMAEFASVFKKNGFL